MEDLPDLLRGGAIEIEPQRQKDKLRTPLAGHESRHGRTNSKLPSLVVAGRDHAPMAASTYGNRFPCEFRPLTHLHGSIEAIHVDMDDFSHNGWSSCGSNR